MAQRQKGVRAMPSGADGERGGGGSGLQVRLIDHCDENEIAPPLEYGRQEQVLPTHLG